jgi:hypothetical protein
MNHVIRNSIILFRSIAIIYILYFYLIGAGIIPNLTITAIAPLYAYSLRKYLIISITTTLLFSNKVRYFTNY